MGLAIKLEIWYEGAMLVPKPMKGEPMKQIIQFHDGQMIRQRVVADSFVVASIFRDLQNCGIDMTTVIATNRFADDYPIGYLHFEYPLVGHAVTGIFGN